MGLRRVTGNERPLRMGSEAWTEHVVLASARVPGKVEEVAMLQCFPKID